MKLREARLANPYALYEPALYYLGLPVPVRFVGSRQFHPDTDTELDARFVRLYSDQLIAYLAYRDPEGLMAIQLEYIP